MYIDVRIPFDEKGRLAPAYNRALAEGDSEWALFLDHDVFLCNPRWYEMSRKAIEMLREDPKAACVGCMSGGDRHRGFMEQNGDPNSNIEDHIEISRGEYFKYGNAVEQIQIHVPGFFMLLKREVACEIGFQQIGPTINNVDVDFGKRLMEAGYHIYLMRGLYVYHRRGMGKLKKDFIIK